MTEFSSWRRLMKLLFKFVTNGLWAKTFRPNRKRKENWEIQQQNHNLMFCLLYSGARVFRLINILSPNYNSQVFFFSLLPLTSTASIQHSESIFFKLAKLLFSLYNFLSKAQSSSPSINWCNQNGGRGLHRDLHVPNIGKVIQMRDNERWQKKHVQTSTTKNKSDTSRMQIGSDFEKVRTGSFLMVFWLRVFELTDTGFSR